MSERFEELGSRSGFRPEPDGVACLVDDCVKPSKTRGYCPAHYAKLLRYGDPEWKRPRNQWRQKDLTGQKFGLLTALEPSGTKDWKCLCDCGRYSVVRTWCLTSGGTSTCGDTKKHRRRDDVTYSAIHRRLRDDRGPARDHSCVDCGKPALHWSYDYGDPAPLLDDDAGPYSADLTHYSPRCRGCHVTFDRLHGRTPRKRGFRRDPSLCTQGHVLAEVGFRVCKRTGRTFCYECRRRIDAAYRARLRAEKAV